MSGDREIKPPEIEKKTEFFENTFLYGLKMKVPKILQN